MVNRIKVAIKESNTLNVIVYFANLSFTVTRRDLQQTTNPPGKTSHSSDIKTN